MAGKQAKKKKKNRGQQKAQPVPVEPVEAIPEEPDKLILLLKIATRVLLVALFFTYVFVSTLKYPLNDPDSWWHLKTGAYTIEHMQLPSDDPFSYTTPKPLNPTQVRGLRTQWLGQVAFAAAEKAGGVGGVVVLRGVLIVLPMLFLFFWLLWKGVRHLPAILIVMFPSAVLVFQLFYSFERPQGFSFLFILLEIMLLERLRRPNRKKFDFAMVALPLLMALWANVHAGFIVGNLVIIIYCGSELFMRGMRKYRGTEQTGAHPVFYAIAVIAILASFLNPNTYHLFYEYATGLTSRFLSDFAKSVSGGGRGSWVEKVVLEFKPLMYFYKELHYKWIMAFWLFTAYPLQPFNFPIPGLLLCLMIFKYWVKKKVDLAELITVIFIWFFANYYARGLMFSLTVLPFYMGKTLLEIKLPPLNYKKLFTAAVAGMLTLTVMFMSFSFGPIATQMLRPRIAPTWITPWYPRLLSEFLEETRIPGPMYNFYTWGGFLIWRLYPQYKVFIDGRALDPKISEAADGVLKTFPRWEETLDAYDINFIVIPVVFRESGNIIPLATALVNNDKWRLIFLQSNSAIFIRNVPRNEKYINRFDIDKRAVYKEIITTCNILTIGMQGNPIPQLSKADALFLLGKYKEAKVIYMRYPRLAARQLAELRKRGY